MCFRHNLPGEVHGILKPSSGNISLSNAQVSLFHIKQQSLEKELEMESRLYLWDTTRKTVKEKGMCRDSHEAERKYETFWIFPV